MVITEISLEIGTFIKVATQTFQSIKDSLDGFPGGAVRVGVFYAEDKFTTGLFGVNQLYRAVLAPPMWRYPVGLGGNRNRVSVMQQAP
jgi:hypothetical protein